MPKEKIITAIDIGSSKICTIVASFTDGKISVIGSSAIPSTGIDRGVVNDIDKAVESISTSLERAEKMAGHAVSKAIITVNGQHIQSENSTGVVAVSDPNGEITLQDVVRVNEAAQAISIPSNREVIHVEPRDYEVDSHGNIKNPEGMSGVRLEVEAHIIHGSSTILKNLVKCVRQVGVEVSDMVFTGLASSTSVLTDTEKELGTVLIDMGGRTLGCVVYQNGSPSYSFVVPVGGKHITGDLAVGLRCSLEIAEKIKIRLSRSDEDTRFPDVLGVNENRLKKGEIYLGDIDPDLNTVPKKFLEKIIHDRLEEMLALIELELSKANYLGRLPAGAIITGGASDTINLADVAKNKLKMPVRIARPRGLSGLIDEVEGPAFSACVGSILHKASALDDDGSLHSSSSKSGFPGNVFLKIKNMFKFLVP